MNDKIYCTNCGNLLVEKNTKFTKSGKVSKVCLDCAEKKKQIEAQKRKDRNIPTCKHCGTTDNIKRGKTGHNLGICLDCFSIIGKTPGQQSREQKNLEKFGVISGFQRDDVKDKIKKSNLENHGVEYPTQSKKIRNKIKSVVQEKYGVDNVSQLESVKSKVIQTNLENLGVEQPFQSKEVMRKAQETNLKKYGNVHPIKTKSIREKRKKTCLDKYGVSNPLRNKKVKEKIVNTNLEKYGCKYASQSEVIKQKIVESNISKYGVDVATKSPIVQEKIKTTRRKNYWSKFLLLLKDKHIKPLFDKNYYIQGNTFEFLCKICNTKFETEITNPQKIVCDCRKVRSNAEIELYNYISDLLDCEVINNQRFNINDTIRELDIYIPEFKLGIEYNGLYWHSEAYKENNYHSEKRDLFDSIDINLIQIFESDWINNQDIVKSLIKSKLGLSKKIYGRDTRIVELSANSAELFFIKNHLKGHVNAKYTFGLSYKDEIVAAMSLSKSRYDGDFEYEILRFATKIDTIVIGGFSKLIKYINSIGIDSLVSYVDLMYFNGNSYSSSGFNLVKRTKPGYYYWNKSAGLFLENRQNYQKHKLNKILENYDDSLTEHENMLNNGFLRIYDAGNLVFAYNNN